MKRRSFIKTLSLGSGILAGMPSTGRSNSSKKLNFVFFLADDLGQRDLSCYGSEFYESPHIDRLCKEGMKFTDGYAACPVCSPTRYSIMTGKYPARGAATQYFLPVKNGQPKKRKCLEIIPAEFNNYMSKNEVTLAEAFKEHEYNTFFAGKWHLGYNPEIHFPTAQGFDYNIGGHARGGPYTGKKYFAPFENPYLVPDSPKGTHLADRLGDEACQFLEKQKNSPFLLYFSFYSVHNPKMAKKEYVDYFTKKAEKMNLPIKGSETKQGRNRIIQSDPVYAGMIKSLDDNVGKVLKKLKGLGLDDNTAVIFMSDNGGLATSEGSPTCNAPLRNGKGWLHEGGVREPLIVKWPGHTQPGSVCAEPVISTDFYATMLEMAGLPLKPEQHVDSRSFVPLLQDKKYSRGPIFWHYPHYSNQGGGPGSAVRIGKFKLIKWYHTDTMELYNLKEDLKEENNLINAMPEKRDELLSVMNKWLKSVKARIPRQNTEKLKDIINAVCDE